MTDRPRILMIPSWYPTKANPLVGSSFQEEIALLQERYDLRVLFGIERPVGYRSEMRHHRWPPRRGCARVRPCPAAALPPGPPAVEFEYFHRSVDEDAAWDAAIDGYRQMLGALIADGWKPDLLHAQASERAGIITCALAREFDIPWVLTENQVFVLSNYPEARRRRMVEALHAATVLVPVSHHQMRCIILHGIDRPMTVLGNPIDERRFPLAVHRRDPACFRLLAVTYPSPYKDCETLFRAVAVMVARGHADIELTVIGNNSFHDIAAANTDYFADLARRFGVERVCRFLAYSPRAEMPRHYIACDAFVSTSVAETFGLAPREAMCVGRPAVCTTCGGIEDDLAPVNGVKVNIRDAEAVADALIAIKNGSLEFDPVAVRKTVVEKHGRDAFLNGISSIYDQARQLSSKSPKNLA